MASLNTNGLGLPLRGLSVRPKGQPPSGVLGAQGVTACLLENEPASYSLSLG
jgi:hypothetical protein